MPVDTTPQTFEALYTQCVRDMYRYALYALGAEQSAQDAVQETTLAAWQNFGALRDREKFRPWIFRILANKCKRMLRSKYRAAGTVALDEMFAETATQDFPLCRALELRSVVAALPEVEREIVLLHVVEGFTSVEIGRIVGCPAGTVRSRLSRTMAKLRKELGEEYYEEAQRSRS